MIAIVLTCDRYRALTAHMVSRYAALWPDHPFRFRAACQQLPPDRDTGIEWRVCPVPIKATVLTLLADLDDEQWVYWCIDDKYPITLDLPRVQALARWLPGSGPQVDGALFCRCRQLKKQPYLTGQRLESAGAGGTLIERRGYEQIWLHQFLRVKVLRHLFGSFPDEIQAAKEMDRLKKSIVKPAAHRLWVTRRNLAMFGESTSRGLLTRNSLESLHRFGLALPEWHDGNLAESEFIGRLPWWHGVRAAGRRFWRGWQGAPRRHAST